jgi:kumamolisin
LGVNTSVQDRWLKDALGTYGVASVELTGKNQTIGILVDSLPNERDLRAFWSSNQIAYVADRVSMTNLALAGESLPTDATEATLDTEWATSVARESKVRVYATGFYSWIKIANALGKIFDETANNPTLHVLSLSFGAGEQDIPPDQVGELMNQLGLLTSKGITIFVSSGDEGDTPRRPYPNEDMRILQVEFPASSPFVTAVGGTSLSFDATTNIVEAGWKGSGGGISSKFRIPNWQKGVGIPQRNLNRLVPDVSLIADPEINIVYGTKVVHVGGTSVSTPIWAGIAALINEGRARNGFAPVGLLNSHIYGLIGNAAMTDIISGSNGSYVAAVGYDMVSGIGVPKVPELIALLSKTQ